MTREKLCKQILVVALSVFDLIVVLSNVGICKYLEEMVGQWSVSNVGKAPITPNYRNIVHRRIFVNEDS